jgi:hypothetical protein
MKKNAVDEFFRQLALDEQKQKEAYEEALKKHVRYSTRIVFSKERDRYETEELNKVLNGNPASRDNQPA